MPADGSAFHTNRPIFHSLSQCAECGVGGEDFASPNTEAFEVTGELYCDDCAGDVLARLAEDEDEDFIDTSVAAMRSAYGTWSV